jgi:hypothetical protein
VSDVEAVHDDLASRGVAVSEVFHCTAGTVCRFHDGDGLFERASGPSPDHTSYSSFATLSDPDGNGWVFQEVTQRLPGRVDPATTSFGSANDLAIALRRAAAAHGEHEKRIGQADENWPDWYAEYMVAERAGASCRPEHTSTQPSAHHVFTSAAIRARRLGHMRQPPSNRAGRLGL